MKKRILLSTIMSGILLFSGCVDDKQEVSLDANETEVIIDSNVTIDQDSGQILTPQSFSGNVADGYLVGAIVCFDIDESGSCDFGEPYDWTKENGFYNIDIAGFNVQDKPLLAQILPSTIDEDDGLEVGFSYSLSAPHGERFVSPISSMVHEKMKEGAPLEKAREVVATSLLIPIEDISKDYIDMPNSTGYDIHEKAKAIVALKREQYMLDSGKDFKISDNLEIINSVLESSQGSSEDLAKNILISRDFKRIYPNKE